MRVTHRAGRGHRARAFTAAAAAIAVAAALCVAVPSAVAMSKVTSAPWAGADRLTMNVAVEAPLLPSVTATSLIDRFGVAPPVQLFVELEFRARECIASFLLRDCENCPIDQ